MKKYMVTTIAAVLSVAVIGSYYVYGAMDKMPEYTLMTVSGDESLVEHLYIDGHYQARRKSEYFTLSLNGTEYQSERPWIWQEISRSRSWLRSMEDIQQLYRDERGFMRGKVETDGFYQDEHVIIYAKMSLSRNIRLHLETLNKATRDAEKFQLSIPAEPSQLYVHVADVQLVGDEVYIMAIYGYRDKTNEFWLYAVDPSAGTILRSEKLYVDAEADAQFRVYTDLLSDNQVTVPSDYVVFHTRQEQVGASGNKETPTSYVNRLFVYSYPSGSMVPLPEEWAHTEGEDWRFQLDGTILYRMISRDSEIVVVHYDLKTGSTGSIRVNAEDVGGDYFHSVELRNGMLYVLSLSSTGEENSVHVLDATNGEKRYEGEITVKGASQEPLLDLWLGGIMFLYD